MLANASQVISVLLCYYYGIIMVLKLQQKLKQFFSYLNNCGNFLKIFKNIQKYLKAPESETFNITISTEALLYEV